MPRFHIRWSIQKVDDSPEGVHAALLCAGDASYCGKSVPCQGRGYCVACYDVESCCQRLLRVNDVRDINEERMTERKPCCRAYRAAGGP